MREEYSDKKLFFGMALSPQNKASPSSATSAMMWLLRSIAHSLSASEARSACAEGTARGGENRGTAPGRPRLNSQSGAPLRLTAAPPYRRLAGPRIGAAARSPARRKSAGILLVYMVR